MYFERILCIPTAATVPKTVEIIAEENASIRELSNADIAASLLNSSLYHLSENPSKTAILFEELKENTIKTTMGAYNRRKTRAI